jgi:hypothetical protein
MGRCFTDQLQCSQLRAVYREEGAVPRDLDGVVERSRVSSVALDVGDGSALEAQGSENIVQAVVRASQDAAGVHTLYLAEGPTQEVEVVDHQVEEDTAAYAPVGVPVVPAQQERRAAAGADHSHRSQVPGVDLLLDPQVLGEETDDVAYEKMGAVA